MTDFRSPEISQSSKSNPFTFRRDSRFWRVILAAAGLGLALIALAGCSSGEEVAPQLQALPTRTPALTEVAPGAGAGAAASNVEVVSLLEPVEAFLAASETASPLDRIDLFMEHVISAAPSCFDTTLWPDRDPLELVAELRLTSLDLAIWQASVNAFPEDALIAEVEAALGDAQQRAPLATAAQVCVIPFPQWAPPENLTRGGVSSSVLDRDTIWLMCSGGDFCQEPIGSEAAFAYAQAYQLGLFNGLGVDLTLLDLIIQLGRADVFARELFPAVTFPWDDALTPEQEADLWDRMQDELATSFGDGRAGRNIAPFVYGSGNQIRYPRWGGQYIGTQIVEAYRAQHPDQSLVDLMAIEPQTLLDESGYTPPPVPADAES